LSSNVRASQSTGAARFGADDTPNRRRIIETGAIGGLVGGVCIWIYEAIVWVWAQHQMPLIGTRPGWSSGRPELTKRPPDTHNETKQERQAALCNASDRARSGLNPALFSDMACSAPHT
jgi:hypothetical protein